MRSAISNQLSAVGSELSFLQKATRRAATKKHEKAQEEKKNVGWALAHQWESPMVGQGPPYKPRNSRWRANA